MILVTGGTGLIGSHLLYELTVKNNHIRAIKRPSSNLQNVLKIFGYYSDKPETLFRKIDWVDVSVTDYYSLIGAFGDIDMVYHCAGLVSYNRRMKKELFETNVKGTSNIVNICLEKKIKKICFVSSIASFGEYDGVKAVDETTRWKPEKKSSLYSLSKLKAEMEVWRGIAEGLSGIIVNPSVVIGPGFWDKGVGITIRLVARGMRFYTRGSTGYVDVRDVAKIMVRLMETDISGEQFLVSSENFTFKEILDLISETLHRRNPDIHANKLVTGLGWRLNALFSWITGKEPVITRDNMRISHKHNLYSGQKIKDVLGYEFITIKDSVRFLAEKYLAEVEQP